MTRVEAAFWCRRSGVGVLVSAEAGVAAAAMA